MAVLVWNTSTSGHFRFQSTHISDHKTKISLLKTGRGIFGKSENIQIKENFYSEEVEYNIKPKCLFSDNIEFWIRRKRKSMESMASRTTDGLFGNLCWHNWGTGKKRSLKKMLLSEFTQQSQETCKSQRRICLQFLKQKNTVHSELLQFIW